MSKYTLPNGVKVGEKLFNQVELDEIRGKHQDILANPQVKTPVDHVLPLLMDLVLDITDAELTSLFPDNSKKEVLLKELPIQDIQFLMAKVRETSYGPDYYMELKCPHCDHNNNAKLDLSSLEVSERKDKLKDSECILPKDKTSFKYKHMSLSHLLTMAVEDGADKFTKTMMTSLTSYMLESLGDSKPVTQKDLGELRGSDLDFIRDNMPELPEIDLKVEHTCTNGECGKDFEQELPVLAADFLLHSRT